MNGSVALIGLVLILIGGFLSGGKMFAKYSGTELVGFEEKSTFKNEKVKTFGLILFIVGILSCCISVGLESIGK